MTGVAHADQEENIGLGEFLQARRTLYRWALY